jgi:hypothetical protein
METSPVPGISRRGSYRAVNGRGLRRPALEAEWLEPISKSPEEDDEASELDEAEEVLGVILPADKDAALPLDPGEEAFYQPPSGVSSESAPVLRRGFAAV